MDISEVTTVCVCGAGTMGSGIAQVAAQSGLNTIQFDLNEAMLDKSKASIEKNLEYLVSKGRMAAGESQAVSSRLLFTANIHDCVADVVIEAIAEKTEAKAALFNQLAAINSRQTIFATNTSSLSVTALQQMVPGPERVAGMHFFNPAHLMKLVEVVKGKYTDEHTVSLIYALAQHMGKVPVHCNDAPGFIVNHVARPYYLEAMHLLETGVADAETIDSIMEATGFKMGPFKLMDLIGMDINYSVSEQVWEALGKPARLKPSAIQKAKVEAGELGRKSGKGFYSYGEQDRGER
jgi:3-hydroxybutyryl-CoA dehydrogenase